MPAAYQISPLLLSWTSWYAAFVVEPLEGASLMEWVTPQHEEIDLNCEISSYANAEL